MITVALFFGGRSNEHEVSIMSCKNVYKALDTDKYSVEPVFITKEGKWRYVDGAVDDSFDEEKTVKEGDPVTLAVGADRPALLIRSDNGWKEHPVDVALPVLHGIGGEDGTIQGLFEMAGIPYVGCGVLASSVAMDKITTKRVIQQTKIRQARYETAYTYNKEDYPEVVRRVEENLGYPVYVKPANAGSSVGVSRAADREGLMKALDVAGKVDSRILIEEEIKGREVECAVLGNLENVQASGVGEILAADSFYTYDAKYNNPQSRTVIDPDLPDETVEEIRRDAVEIFRMINGSGLSRVDFFVDKTNGEVVFNEINTLPGYTGISMWPMLWSAKGLDMSQQVDRLISLALAK